MDRRADPIVIERNRLLDDLLGTWSVSLGSAECAYRGHVYRVYNIARELGVPDAHTDELAVASFFHDIGIWSDKTFDYLGPSIARADDYMQAHCPGRARWLVESMIENHHALRRRRGDVEAFRKAHLVDLTHGRYRAGLDKAFLAELVAAFPYGAFHRMRVHAALAWWFRHPFRPLHMVSFAR